MQQSFSLNLGAPGGFRRYLSFAVPDPPSKLKGRMPEKAVEIRREKTANVCFSMSLKPVSM
jgi:hypothetical protein